MTLYRTIYADPPWPEFGGGQIKRGADRHYHLMKVEDIKALGIRLRAVLDENCHLYLWVTNNFLPAGLEVMKEWGFTYKTKIEWVKGDPETHELERFGLGQYFRGITESCLFGVRGMVPYKVLDGKRAQGQTVLFAHRQEHSVKPEEMRKMIEHVSSGPFLEMFARRQVTDHLFSHWEQWDVWGDQVEGSISL